MPDTICEVSMISAIRFWRRKFLNRLPYMGMAAIWVVSQWLCEQTLFPPSHEISIWSLASIGLVVASEEKMFENVDDVRRTADDGGLPILEAHQWAFDSGELKYIKLWNYQYNKNGHILKNLYRRTTANGCHFPVHPCKSVFNVVR